MARIPAAPALARRRPPPPKTRRSHPQGAQRGRAEGERLDGDRGPQSLRSAGGGATTGSVCRRESPAGWRDPWSRSPPPRPLPIGIEQPWRRRPRPPTMCATGVGGGGCNLKGKGRGGGWNGGVIGTEWGGEEWKPKTKEQRPNKRRKQR